jgi:hypothetical protein
MRRTPSYSRRHISVPLPPLQQLLLPAASPHRGEPFRPRCHNPACAVEHIASRAARIQPTPLKIASRFAAIQPAPLNIASRFAASPPVPLDIADRFAANLPMPLKIASRFAASPPVPLLAHSLRHKPAYVVEHRQHHHEHQHG